jgi:GT2 family glycosyltransferase
LAEVGGFHPDSMPKELIRFRGDGETFVSRRLIESGYKAVYSPSAKIHHLVPASRMTIDYFCHRAYIQGISDSSTQIREERGLLVKNSSHNNGIEICRFLKRMGNSIKNRAVRYKKKLFPTEYDRIRIDMQKGYRKGFVYHQREVQKDPKLLEWVLRTNYLGENGKLPE